MEVERKKQILDDLEIAKIDNWYQCRCSSEMGKIRSFSINLTYKCNLNCGYCYQKRYRTHVGTMKEDDIPYIKAFVDNYNKQEDVVERITISGGEVLLEENLPIIDKIFKSFKEKNFTLFTNGINVTKYKDRIDFRKFTDVQISLDGDDDVINELSNYENVNLYERIIEGIHYLSDLGCKITIICMITPKISERIETFAQRLKQAGILDKIEKMRIAIPVFDGSEDVVDRRYFNYEDYHNVKVWLSKNEYDGKIELDTLSGFSKLKSKIWRGLNVMAEGRTRNCKISEKIPVTFGPEGHVYWCACEEPGEENIGNYYENKVNNELLDKIKNRTIFNIEKCKSCKMRYICATGCPLKLFARGVDVMNPSCGEFDNEYLVDRMEDFIL